MSSLLIYIIVLTFAAVMLGYSRKPFDVPGVIGLITVILFAGGRYGVGTDYYTYMLGIYRASRKSWGNFFSSGDATIFNTINKFTFDLGGRVLTWSVIAALVIIPLYLMVKKQYSDVNFFTAFSLYLFSFFTTSFNTSREFIAVSIVAWGIKYVFENKIYKFALCVILATMFHPAAFVSVVFWFFWSHKNNSYISGGKQAFLIFASSIAVVVYQELIAFFSSTFTFLSAYSQFAEVEDDGLNRDFYLNLLVFIIVLFCSKKLKERDPRLQYMVSLLAIATLIGITGFTQSHIKRIANYFAVPAQVVIAGYLPSSKTAINKQTVVFLIYLYAVARFVLVAYVLRQGNLIPYKFRLF